MSETKILQQVAALRDIASSQEILETARKHGIKMLPDSGRSVPAFEKDSYTILEASKVFNLDYRMLLDQVNRDLIPVFRPISRRGTPGRRHIKRTVMEQFVKSFEE